MKWLDVMTARPVVTLRWGRWVPPVLVVGVAALLVGCGGRDRAAEPPPVAASVTDLDPCDVVGPAARTDLKLEPDPPATDGYRRTCELRTNRDMTNEDDKTEAINLVTVVIRQSSLANTIADAPRLAEVYRRERNTTVAVSVVENRQVYRVVEAPPASRGPLSNPTTASCLLLFAVDNTSSVEVTAWFTSTRMGCTFHNLTAVLARQVPVTRSGAPPPHSDRPTDIMRLDPCRLIDPQRRTALGLDAGIPSSSTGAPSCRHSSPGTRPGELNSVFVALRTLAAADLPADANSQWLTVNGRRVHRTQRAVTSNEQTCTYDFEGTRTTSVMVEAWVYGTDPQPACQILADLAPGVETTLPLIAV